MSHGKTLEELVELLKTGLTDSKGAKVSFTGDAVKNLARLLNDSEHVAAIASEDFLVHLADELQSAGANKGKTLESFAKTGILPSNTANPLAKAVFESKSAFADAVAKSNTKIRPMQAELEAMQALSADGIKTGEDILNVVKDFKEQSKTAAEAVKEAGKNGGVASQQLINAQEEAAARLAKAEELTKGITKSAKEKALTPRIRAIGKTAATLESSLQATLRTAEANIHNLAETANKAVKSYVAAGGTAAEVSHAGFIDAMKASVSDAVTKAGGAAANSRSWPAAMLFQEKTVAGSNKGARITKFAEGFAGNPINAFKNMHTAGKFGTVAAAGLGALWALGAFKSKEPQFEGNTQRGV